MIFRCQDHDGREVVLEAETWHDKILPKRPWMRDQQYAVEVTVREPDFVTKDSDYADRLVYYKRGVLLPPENKDLLKVVVEIQQAVIRRPPAKVITAFPTDRAKDGEQEVWRPKRKRVR